MIEGRRTRIFGVMALAAIGGLMLAWQSRPNVQSPGADVHQAPPGMVYVPGGRTRIGSEDGPPAERPVFVAEVRPFYLDVHPVTVAEFRRFVEVTGYVTDAEKAGSAGVMDFESGRWDLVPGASWRLPSGARARPAPDDHPVTQVSWNDASAYARWAGKRLPTEIEWEHAARGARDARDSYSWGGNALIVGGGHRTNTWQGPFPGRNSGADGFELTSPVGQFGRTSLGLTDMGGNVWQWCEDWFRSYTDRSQPFTPRANAEKVQRGGSFLCSREFCHGYRVSARSHSTPDTALFHTGFRCARDRELAAERRE
jgi:sulfatase modifying factor 1